MAGRSMDKTRARLIRHMIAREQRHGKIITACKAFQRVVAYCTFESLGGNIDYTFPFSDQSRFSNAICERVRQDQPVAGLGPWLEIGLLHGDDFIEPVGHFRTVADRSVTGDRPGRRRPDDDGGALFYSPACGGGVSFVTPLAPFGGAPPVNGGSESFLIGNFTQIVVDW